VPGHGDPILQTFDQWMVRVNKRLSRLERRQSRPGGGTDVAGQVTLWVDDPGVPAPAGWVPLDGTSYPEEMFPRLAALLGGAGTVTVPDVPAPAGLMYIMRT
jgi:hypothetical protein